MLNWVEKMIQRLAEYIARRMPPTGRLALAGCAVANVRAFRHLPVDRRSSRERWKPDVDEMGMAIHQARGSSKVVGTIKKIKKAKKNLVLSAKRPQLLWLFTQVTCSSPQYCFLHGYPCACCGGSDTSCPPGTQAGSYWSYCCNHRMIQFVDCCGGTVNCPSGCVWCSNSNQPNWCGGAGNNRYVCTQAADRGAC